MTVGGLPELDPAKRYALLVGIGKYPRFEYELPGPPDDLRAMRSLLVRRYGFDDSKILTLADRDATRDSIVWAFRNHLKQPGADGLTLFYFVGHGLQLDSNYSVQDKESGSRDQALFVWGKNGRGAILLDDELNVLLQELRAKRVVVVLDGCYSGTGAQFWDSALRSRVQPRDAPVLHVMSVTFSQPGDPADLPDHFISDGKRVVPNDSMSMVFLGAAEESRRAYSVSRWPTSDQSRSVFSYYLGSALDQGVGTGSQSFIEVNTGIVTRIKAWDVCQNRGKCQVPQVHGSLARVAVAEVLGPPR